jgi:hypothetical protein
MVQVQNSNQVFLHGHKPGGHGPPPANNDWGFLSQAVCVSNDWRFVTEAACVFNEWGHLTDPVC